MLKIENLDFSYSLHGEGVLKNVCMELPKGKIGVVLGRNGSGKTTLFNCITGVKKPKNGTMKIADTDLLTIPQRERAKLIAYVPQELVFGDLSIFDTVLMGRISRFGVRPDKTDVEKTCRVLEELFPESRWQESVLTLSGGEKQKVAVGRALAQEPELLVFDEPTGNLDVANGQLVLTGARRLATEKNITVLCSLHDLNQAMGLGDRFFFMKNGTVWLEGGKEIFTPQNIEAVFGYKVQIIEHEGKKYIV